MSGRRLLIISSVRWNYLWQRHHALAAAAAADGWRVDFLEPHPRSVRQVAAFLLRRLRKKGARRDVAPVPEGVRVLSPAKWLRPPGGEYDLALCYLPDGLAFRLLRRLHPSRIVYDAVLDWAAVPGSWYPPRGWRKWESRLAQEARVACATDAPGMRDELRRRGIEATVVPPAADPPFLARPGTEPRKGTALYFGSIRDEVDVDVLLALQRAGLAVEVIGTIENATVRERLCGAGVTIHPPIDLDGLAAAVARFQFVLLPYRGSRARTLVPAKLWNCIASGRWVLCSGLDPSLASADAPNVVMTTGAEELVAAARSRSNQLLPPTPVVVPTWGERWREILRVTERQ